MNVTEGASQQLRAEFPLVFDKEQPVSVRCAIPQPHAEILPRQTIIRQSAHQTFHCLILNQTDPYQARYFRREAKKWMRRLLPSTNSTSICPKSC